MDVQEFNKYVEILREKPFALFPAPQGFTDNRFTYVDNTQAHVNIQNTVTEREYLLPLMLVEFANPGVLRLKRAVRPFNGSFV
jgi:hypothetical protein